MHDRNVTVITALSELLQEKSEELEVVLCDLNNTLVDLEVVRLDLHDTRVELKVVQAELRSTYERLNRSEEERLELVEQLSKYTTPTENSREARMEKFYRNFPYDEGWEEPTLPEIEKAKCVGEF